MTIIIMHQTIANHDAIGTDIEIMYHILKQSYKCYCFAQNPLNKNIEYIENEEKLVQLLDDSENLVIYHHSVYWEYGEKVLNNTNARIIFRYHNITPEQFFKPYNDFHYQQCYLGREQTNRLIEKFPEAFWLSDSEYNLQDLKQADQEKLGVCPPFNKIEEWSKCVLDEKIVKDLIESKYMNLLFVGRVAPNKGHLMLIDILYWYCSNFDNNIVLNIIGKFDEGLFGYNHEIKDKIQKYGLEDNIKFIGEINDSILMSYYMGCDAFICASEHEGFCVPVVEAQYFMLPVLALDSSALRETMGEEQLVFRGSPKQFASAVKILKDNRNIRDYLKAIGKKNFENRFSYNRIRNQFENILKERMGIEL